MSGQVWPSTPSIALHLVPLPSPWSDIGAETDSAGFVGLLTKTGRSPFVNLMMSNRGFRGVNLGNPGLMKHGKRFHCMFVHCSILQCFKEETPAEPRLQLH